MSFVGQFHSIASLNLDFTEYSATEYYREMENKLARSRVNDRVHLALQTSDHFSNATPLYYYTRSPSEGGKAYALFQPSVSHLYRRSCYVGNNDNV